MAVPGTEQRGQETLIQFHRPAGLNGLGLELLAAMLQAAMLLAAEN